MSLTKLSLDWTGIILLIKLFLSRESLVSDIPAGDEKMANLSLQCMVQGNLRSEKNQRL
jgi:hypothetical protein